MCHKLQMFDFVFVLILKVEIPRQLGRIPLLRKICPEQLLNVTSIKINAPLPSFSQKSIIFYSYKRGSGTENGSKADVSEENNSDVAAKLNEAKERHILGYLSTFICSQCRFGWSCPLSYCPQTEHTVHNVIRATVCYQRTNIQFGARSLKQTKDNRAL